ncbi:MAG: hypothetical protein ACJ75H_22975 [Thermoanaerobaculia bacterium]
MAKSEHVKKALDQYGDELTRIKNVVGVGRVPSETKKGEWDLAVYVAEKVPEDRLAAKDMVPKTLEITGRGGKHAVKTQVIEQGVVELERL